MGFRNDNYGGYSSDQTRTVQYGYQAPVVTTSVTQQGPGYNLGVNPNSMFGGSHHHHGHGHHRGYTSDHDRECVPVCCNIL